MLIVQYPYGYVKYPGGYKYFLGRLHPPGYFYDG